MNTEAVQQMNTEAVQQMNTEAVQQMIREFREFQSLMDSFSNQVSSCLEDKSTRLLKLEHLVCTRNVHNYLPMDNAWFEGDITIEVGQKQEHTAWIDLGERDRERTKLEEEAIKKLVDHSGLTYTYVNLGGPPRPCHTCKRLPLCTNCLKLVPESPSISDDCSSIHSTDSTITNVSSSSAGSSAGSAHSNSRKTKNSRRGKGNRSMDWPKPLGVDLSKPLGDEWPLPGQSLSERNSHY